MDDDKEPVELISRKSESNQNLFSANSALDRIYQKLPIYFENFTGHHVKCVTSFNNFVEFMHKDTDAASLGIARMMFGIMMLLDIPEERSGADLDYRWGEPRDCRFPLFNFLSPLSLPKMGIVYIIMWLGALGITLGYKYKVSCTMFVIPYWYIFLLDKSSWNNHSYLYGLISVMFLLSDAHHYCSIDAWKHKLKAEVPFWNYFLLKYQFFILYFIAGLKKFSTEWLTGYSMANLSYHWVFAPFRLILGPQLTDLLIIHWFAAIFDLTIAFWLIYEKIRPIATLFCAAFHLMNSRLFKIGMFPWVCLAELPLFYKVDWPRILWRKLRSKEEGSKTSSQSPQKSTKKSSKIRILLILSYCWLQLFLPYSHFITKGYNNWVNGVYGYSWDMMIHTWQTILVSVKVVDNANGKIHYVEPMAFSESDRWTKHPDMSYQYAKCIEQNLHWDYLHNKETVLTSNNFSIYFDVWCSLNGRFQQRIINPTVDLLKSDWSPFQKPTFTLPLLTEYTNFRQTMSEISKNVFTWSNYTDLVFIADFPGLALDNYIISDLDNVTLTVLDGAVRFELSNESKSSSLSRGQNIPVKSDVFHKVTTISDFPATYMYTYVNATRQILGISLDDIPGSLAQMQKKPLLPLIEEFLNRVDNYKKFFAHVTNSILFEFYKVPMPRRIRELQEY